MVRGSDLIMYFICDDSGKTITFPSSWYWPGGYNKVVTIASKIVAVEIHCDSNGEIHALFTRAGTSFDIGSVRITPPFISFGTATYESIFGGQMLASQALTSDDTLTNWSFPLAKVKTFSSPVRVLTAVGGVLTIPFDGQYSAFVYTHDTDLTRIVMTMDLSLASKNFCWNLRIITGASTQRALPVPEGCMVAEDEIVIKEGNAFLSGLWTNTRMFVMPVSAFDFT